MAEPEANVITGAITTALVLAADDPAALARFYGALLHVEPQPGLSGTHWRVAWPAGGWLEVYAPSKNRPRPRPPGRLGVCLQRKADAAGALALLHAWIDTALELGASVDDPPRLEPFGAEAWLLDPEGNRLLLLVLPAQVVAGEVGDQPRPAMNGQGDGAGEQRWLHPHQHPHRVVRVD